MKKDKIEFLDFDDKEIKNKVGRPKLASKDEKKKSLIFAFTSIIIVIILIIFGYGTLFGFKGFQLLGSLGRKNEDNFKNIPITEIKPILKNISLKPGTIRKIYLTVSPVDASNKNIKYTSSDKKVATVDEEGRVTAIKAGKAVITAITTDGTNKSADFNIKVVKDTKGVCDFTSLDRQMDSISYSINCNNAKIKEIQFKTGDSYKSLTSKKSVGEVKLSKNDLNKNVTFKVIYYPNNSKVTKFSTKSINNTTTTKKKKTGMCELSINNVKTNSCKYDITCNNATVTSIAYKLGNGSYIGIDNSSLADTILFEESDVTRIIYFNIEYKIDGTDDIKTITKSSIVDKKVEVPEINQDIQEEAQEEIQ